MDGAYPFVMLFNEKYGMQHFHVLTRTNAGTPQVPYHHHGRVEIVDSWVLRFIKRLGLMDIGNARRKHPFLHRL